MSMFYGDLMPEVVVKIDPQPDNSSKFTAQAGIIKATLRP